MALTLGPVLFTSFEIPEKVNFGGRQTLLTHKLPGGQRVIDAMGPDDDDIAWQGRFRGGLAPSRARAVDAIRVAGLPVTLAWGGFRFTVLVSEFKADYQQAYEIPYTLACVVVTPPPGTAAPGLADLLGTDITRALGVGLSQVADAVAGVQSAVAAAKALRGGLRGGIGGVLGSVAAAQSALAQVTSAADGVLAFASLPSPDAVTFATDLLTQADAVSRLEGLHAAAASLGRMAANLTSFRG